MNDLDVIVIGGSAGALDALLGFLPALSHELATPIVLVLHLPPAQPSLLPEVLRRACARPVEEVEDKAVMQPRTIYVAPPNYHVLIERDHSLALSVDPLVQFSRPSIDVLFESAADAFGRSALGVLLSGANEDGSQGLARILRAGGSAVVQSPGSARYPEMPASAVRQLGAAARVVSIGELAGELSRLAAPGGAMTLHQDGLR